MSKPTPNSIIRLRGVRHNNLKNFDLDLPLHRLIVITGLSGSGKSSLAFDTLFAEGQRRYIETFSPYARQFFDRMDKPQVDSIEGIPPAIAIEQRNAVRTTRSTVGTMTEICDYMKLLWPYLAQLHCRQCAQPVRKDSPQAIWRALFKAEPGTRNSGLLVTFDLPLSDKLPLEESLALVEKQGYQRVLLPVVKEERESAVGLALREQAYDTDLQRQPVHLGSTPHPACGHPLPSSDEGRGLGENSPNTHFAFYPREPERRLRATAGGLGASCGLPPEGGAPPAVHGEGCSLSNREPNFVANGHDTPGGPVVEAVGGNCEAVRIDEAVERLRALKPGSLTIIQDRLELSAANRARFVEACEQAYHFGKGRLAIHALPEDCSIPTAGQRITEYASRITRRFSNRLHCAECDLEYREPTPALFSFNHPIGACPACRGFGRIISIDYALVMPDHTRTLAEGVVKPWLTGQAVEHQDDLMKFCKKRKVPTNVLFEQMPRELQDWVVNGDPDYGKDDRHRWPYLWYGVKGYFRWLESRAYKMHVRVLLSRYRAYTPCPDCGGRRFQPEALLYKFAIDDLRVTHEPEGPASVANRKSQITLADFYTLPVRDALEFIDAVAATRAPQSAVSGSQAPVAADPLVLALNEVRSRLGYLAEVGLGYLTLDRPTRTLSGGETERVNLTTCLGTRLVNTLFVLDEPSVGLHPRDTARLVRILEQLRDAGNTVVVVEHEAGVIRVADQVVDLGPAQGERGGAVVFQGTFKEMLKSKESLTGQYLSGRKQIGIPSRRSANVRLASSLSHSPGHRSGVVTADAFHETLKPLGDRQDGCPTLRLEHAARHNLKDLSVAIPLGRFVCITGVSGSGKTTLVRDVLLPALEAKLKAKAGEPHAANLSRTGNEEEDESESTLNPQPSTTLADWETVGRVVLVDQSSLGKTPRSNPAVYVGAFDAIRELFAHSEPARQRGLNASAFSFNSAQGQCQRCRGAGFEKIEMQFLSDVFIRCPDCDGRRYRPHILEVKVSSQWSVVSGQQPHLPSATDHGPRTKLGTSPICSTPQ